MVKLLKIACFMLSVSGFSAAANTVESGDLCNPINGKTNTINSVNTMVQPLLSSGATINVNSFIDAALQDPAVLQGAVENRDNTLHLFSHGRPGELLIAGKWLLKEDIALFINSQFSPLTAQSTPLNIYACNFAQGKKGRAAVAYLEQELGLQIAASTNVTGKDGDWTLEVGALVQKPLAIAYNYNLQIGNTHYLPPHVAARYGNANDWDYEEVVLSTPSSAPISITVTNGSTGTQITGSPFSISNGSPTVIVFDEVGSVNNRPISMRTDELGIVRSGKGLILTSTDDFYVNYRALTNRHAASLTSKALAAQGTDFRWAVPPGYLEDKNHTYVSIMAVENATVTIDNYDNALIFTRNGANGGPITNNTLTVILLAGESIIYELDEVNNGSVFVDGHVGARIVSTGKIVVNTGGQNGKFTNNDLSDNGQDHGVDQLVPTNRLGKEYVVIQGNGTGDLEKIVITAIADNTDIFINGSASPIITINDGDYFRLDGTNFMTQALYIRSSQRVYVHHALIGKSDADGHANQGLTFIPPLSSSNVPTVINEIAFIGNIQNTNFDGTELNIVFEVGAMVSVEEDGVPISLPTAQNITGTADFQFYNIPFTNTMSVGANYAIFSDSAISASVFGVKAAACFASYFSGFIIGPNIALVKTGALVDLNGDGCAEPGEIIDYSFSVTNQGDELLTSIVVTDPLTGLGPITYDSGDIDGNDQLDLGETWIYSASYIISQTDLDAGSVLNQATAQGTGAAATVTDLSGTTVTNDDNTIVTLCNYCTDGATVGVVTTNDPDADGINNVCDLDDDNDGILDAEESTCTVTTTPVDSVTDADFQSGEGALSLINDVDATTADAGVAFNQPAHYIVIDLGQIYEYGSVIKFDWWTNDGDNRQHTINQKASSTYAAGGTNTVVIDYPDTEEQGFFKYTLNAATRYVQVDMTARDDGRVEILEATITTSCTNTDIDVDLDGIINQFDLDSDNDGCDDVVESGGNDPDNDGVLGEAPYTYDGNGQVTGTNATDGYDGLTGNEYSAVQLLVTPLVNLTVLNMDPVNFTITASADQTTSYLVTGPNAPPNTVPDYSAAPGNVNTGINYQWYLGDPSSGGTALSNAGVYSGVDTATLNISDPSGLNGSEYFVEITHDDYVCGKETASAVLSIIPRDYMRHGKFFKDNEEQPMDFGKGGI